MFFLFIGFAVGVGCGIGAMLIKNKIDRRLASVAKLEAEKQELQRQKSALSNFKCKHDNETGKYCGTCGASIPKIEAPLFPREITDKCDADTCDYVYRFRAETKYRRCTKCGNADKESQNYSGTWKHISPSRFPNSNT